MMEAAVVVDLDGNPIHWHLPPGRSSVYLPDAPDLWSVLWSNRQNLLGVAHSHPGSGRPFPSYEDTTTFSAIESALGIRLSWWICTQDKIAIFKWVGDRYRGHYELEPCSWLPQLRQLSY